MTMQPEGTVHPLEVAKWRIVAPDLRKPEFEHLYHDPQLKGMSQIAKDYAIEMAYAAYTEQAILTGMFGNAMGAIRSTIAANSASTTSITTGSLANAGTSGSMDQTPTSTTTVYNGHPAASPSVNNFSVVQSFLLTASAATSLTITSITTGYAVTHNATSLLSDVLFVGGSVTVGGLAAQTSPVALSMYQALYIGLSTQAFSGATQALEKSGEPASANGYARIGDTGSTPTPLWNNQANWPNAATASPYILTPANGPWSFPASSGSWASGSNLQTMFIVDTLTNGSGNVLAIGALGTAQAVAASGITLSFATQSGAITLTLT